ncbi:MAG: DHH family phosphoesterase [Candidatus Nealsonbacteria bacterium]
MEDFSQAKNLIERSNSILILPPKETDGDTLAGSLALFSTLKKLEKNVNVLIEKIPEKFKFLDDQQLKPSGDFVISVNAAGKEISKMRYERNNDDLRIYLTMGKGELKNKDISFPVITQPLNLLVTIGIKSLTDIEEFFEQNSCFLSDTPILNIDNHPSNNNFGDVNLVNADSSSSEILTNLIRFMESEDEAFLDKNIATYLLTGVICASQNFRNPTTKPKTFETSAFLIERGGNHQKIIQHLYKQKNVSQVNLLGKILEKLSFNKPRELYSASLTEKDFQECRASSRDLGFVVEELKFNFRYLPNLLILWESRASPVIVKGIFYSAKRELIEKILQNYEGVSKGDGVLFIIREQDVDSAKENFLGKLT